MEIASETNTIDQRLFERFPARFPAKFKDTRDDFGSRIQLRDASAQGARILSKDRVFLNDSVSLEVELPDGHTPMTLRGQVMWVKNTTTDAWDVGLKFYKTSLMSLSRLYKFVEPAMA